MNATEQKETGTQIGYIVPDESDDWSATERIADAVKRLTTGALALIKSVVGTQSSSNATAYGIAALRRAVVNAANMPDWSGKSALYRVNYEGFLTSALEESFPGEENKALRESTYRKVRENARQALNRVGILEAEIVDYCLETTPNVDSSKLKWTAVKGDADEPNAAPALLTGVIPANLKTAIRKQYETANLTVPEKFGGPKKGSGSGGGDRSKESDIGAIGEIAGSLENGKVKPGSEMFDSVHRLVTFLVQSTRTAEEVPGGKDHAAEMFEAMSEQLSLGAQILRGHFTGRGTFDTATARLAALAWTAPEK